jgi:hypothetical protein
VAGKAKYIIIGILSTLGILVLLYIGAVIYENQQNSNQNQPKESDVSLFNENFAVDAGHYKIYYVRIEISDKQYNRIEGNSNEKSGHGINFLILDTKNYNAWKEDNGNAMAYVKEKNVVNYDFSFVPDHSDDYYFVFDNTNSILTNKLVDFHASWKYRQ